MRYIVICSVAIAIGFISGGSVAIPFFTTQITPVVTTPPVLQPVNDCGTFDHVDCYPAPEAEQIISPVASTTVATTSIKANFNEEIVLLVGDQAIFADNLEVTLVGINDSRCKPDVQCIWAGELSPQLMVSMGSLSSSTNLSFGTVTQTTQTYGQYTISLSTTTTESATMLIKINPQTARTVPVPQKNTLPVPVVTKSITPIPTPKPVTQATSVAPIPSFAAEVATLIETATTKFRIEQSLRPFASDRALAVSAKKYSEILLAGNYLAHIDKSGCDLTCRFSESKYPAQSWGENLAMMTYDEQPSPEYVANFFMTEWKKSAGHRQNLLSPAFTNQGVGVSVDTNSIYVTVHFALPL